MGDRVFAHHHVGCGTCGLCRAGKQHAVQGVLTAQPCPVRPGRVSSSCPKYNVDRGAVLKLPDSLGYEEASFIEPLACCILGLDQAGAKGRTSAVVYGAGPVGLTHLKLLRSYGVKTLGIADVSEYRISLAQRMGADVSFNPTVKERSARARSPLSERAPSWSCSPRAAVRRSRTA